MAKDLLYYYDKPSEYISGGYVNDPFVGHELGEIQSDFNMSLVIDGTKDSMKVQVLSFIPNPLKPYTIIMHPSTDTWWIVSNDKIERYEHENQPYWIHQIELVGLIELLNARDLTGCGFNKERYNFRQFIERLFKLSNLEFRNISINTTGDFSNIVDVNQRIDYVKTFENYTLLSALREFLDGYNLSCKAKIITARSGTPRRYFNRFTLYIYPKTGNTNTIYNESVFSSVNETQTMDKDSHGTIVVSNAQNVISTQTKTFPSVGAVNLSSTEYEVSAGTSNSGNSSACIRLPSPAYKVNWVRMFNQKMTFTIALGYNVGGSSSSYDYSFTVNTSSKESCWLSFNEMLQKIISFEDMYASGDRTLSNQFSNSYTKESWYEHIVELCCPTFYECDVKYNPNLSVGNLQSDPDNLFTTNSNKPLLKFRAITAEKYWVLGRKSLHDGVSLPYQVMYWESGSDLIKNFNYFSSNNYDGTNNSAYRIRQECNFNITNGSNDIGNTHYFYIVYPHPTGDNNLWFKFKDVAFVVNYVPMSDIKVKLDNSKDNFDTQYYNQSGKLTDSSALSKLLLSYSKEIESITITKYGIFYKYEDMPKVGGIVYIDNKPYVINNISYNFNQNEDSSYVIYGEFTMSLYVATKSLMANPNTNIRDYNIPQTQNVRRVQVYKDYYDFTLGQYAEHTESNYMLLEKYFNVDRTTEISANTYIMETSHNCVMKITDSNENEYYYQLETTIYNLKKSVYEVLDFKDNNIIGYSSCNTTTGLNFSFLIDGTKAIVNTPVQYTDDYGEFVGIDIYFANEKQTNDSWADFVDEQGVAYGIDSSMPVQNYSCIIDDIVFGYFVELNNYDFEISESDYYKDATEVPVFEYVCELNDTPQIIVGDNALNYLETDLEYYYCFLAVPKGTNNNNVVMSNLQDLKVDSSPNHYRVDKGVIFQCDNTHIYLNFFDHLLSSNGQFYYTGCGSYNSINNILNLDTQDLLIYRIAKTPISTIKNGYWINTRKEIVFIISGQAIKDNLDYCVDKDPSMQDPNGYTVNCLFLDMLINNYKL